MTKDEEKYMDAKFKEQTSLIVGQGSLIKEQGENIKDLTKALTPMAIKIAIVEEKQKEHPTVNKLYAVVGGLVTFVITLAAIVVTLMFVAKT